MNLIFISSYIPTRCYIPTTAPCCILTSIYPLSSPSLCLSDPDIGSFLIYKYATSAAVGECDTYRESEPQANAVEIKQLRVELSLARHLLTGTRDRIDERSASIDALSKTINQSSDVNEVRHALDRMHNACESIEEWCKGVRLVDIINKGRQPLAHDQDMHLDEKILARYSDMAGTGQSVRAL
jgi:hypothetical protein